MTVFADPRLSFPSVLVFCGQVRVAVVLTSPLLLPLPPMVNSVFVSDVVDAVEAFGSTPTILLLLLLLPEDNVATGRIPLAPPAPLLLPLLLNS